MIHPVGDTHRGRPARQVIFHHANLHDPGQQADGGRQRPQQGQRRQGEGQTFVQQGSDQNQKGCHQRDNNDQPGKVRTHGSFIRKAISSSSSVPY